MYSKNMKEFVLTLVCFISLILSCREERNKISFNNNLIQIQDTIKEINKLLKPFEEISYNFYDEKVLLKDTIRIGEINPELLHEFRLSRIYADTEIRIFTALLFLKKNGISSCFRYREFGTIFYSYKRPWNLEFEDLRFIISSEDQIDTLQSFKEKFNLLDRKGNLILISPIR